MPALGSQQQQRLRARCLNCETRGGIRQLCAVPLRRRVAEAFQPKTLRGVEAQVKLKMTELFTYDLPEVRAAAVKTAGDGSDMVAPGNACAASS